MSNDAARVESELDTLRTMLEVAGTLLGDLTRDSSLSRLISVFSAMPPADRETILDVLEREVGVRRVTIASKDVTGWQTWLNPNARLYVRSLGSHDQNRVPAMAADDMAVAVHRLGRILPLLRSSALIQQWRAALRQAYGMLDVDERTAVVQHCHDLLVIAAQIDASDWTREPPTT